jgi:hypothetical protein
MPWIWEKRPLSLAISLFNRKVYFVLPDVINFNHKSRRFTRRENNGLVDGLPSYSSPFVKAVVHK